MTWDWTSLRFWMRLCGDTSSALSLQEVDVILILVFSHYINITYDYWSKFFYIVWIFCDPFDVVAVSILSYLVKNVVKIDFVALSKNLWIAFNLAQKYCKLLYFKSALCWRVEGRTDVFKIVLVLDPNGVFYVFIQERGLSIWEQI